MSFVTTQEEIAASKEIANSVMDAVTTASHHGIVLHALTMVLTYYLAICCDHHIFSTAEADSILDDFHRLAKEKLAVEGLGAKH